MDKYSINYDQLDGGLNTKKVYRLADVKGRIEKVAFDIVRFIDSENIDGLWRIENRNDGDVIVAMYEESQGKEAKASSDPWSAIADKANTSVSVFYKGEPVRKIAVASVGLQSDDARSLARSLPSMLQSNSALVRKMLKEMNADERTLLVAKYPELTK